MLNRKSDGGFTLIELLVVLAIIGLLVSVIMIFIGPARGKTRDVIRETEMRQIFTAQEIVKGEDEKYACVKNDTDGRAAGFDDACSENVDTIQSAVGRKYLTPFPKDPQDPTKKYIAVDNSLSRGKFCVYTALESTRTDCDPRYFVASHKGTGEVCNTAPADDLDNCGL